MSLLSTIASAFKGGGGPRVPLARSFVSPWARALDGGAAHQPFNYDQAVRRGFVANPVAQRAVRIVSEGVGSAPIACPDPAMAQLVTSSANGQSLMETLAAHLLLHGNAYAQVLRDGSGKPCDLYALRPDRMAVIAGEDGGPSAYRYRLAERTLTLPLLDEDGWPNLVPIRALHPTDDHYGAGCLSAAEQAVAIHNAASRWNRALLDNAARPSGALIYDTADAAGLTDAQFERLRQELAEAYSGQGNAGRPLLLEGGLSWQSMSMSPADMDFATLKAAAARDIALAFGVPPMLLGLPGDNTYANYREANRALWRLTLLPMADKILRALQAGLEPWFPDRTLAVDLDRVPALSEDREKLWAQVSGADFLSDEEKRALLGIAERAETKGHGHDA